MKSILAPLFFLLLGLVACQKEELPSVKPAPVVSLIRSDSGNFMPFGLGSTWTYDLSIEDTTHGTPTTIVSTTTHTHVGQLVFNNKVYFDINGAYLRLKNGSYYKYLNNRNGETPIMIENPVVGATWRDTTLEDAAGLFPLLHTYTVAAIGQTLTVAAGTFNDVVVLDVTIRGYQDATTEQHYYQKGVGLLLQNISYLHYPKSSSMELRSYSIQ